MTQFMVQRAEVVVQGDTFQLGPITLRDENDNVIDITSWAISARISNRASSAPFPLEAVVTKTTPAAGVFKAVWSPAQTELLTPNAQYSYEVRVSDTAGLIKTPLRGLLTVLDSLTV